jgi:hypothetical protein
MISLERYDAPESECGSRLHIFPLIVVFCVCSSVLRVGEWIRASFCQKILTSLRQTLRRVRTLLHFYVPVLNFFCMREKFSTQKRRLLMIHGRRSAAPINGGVYDLTAWISKHPGGERAILSICGKDGSAAFNDQHGGQRRPANELSGFKIGTIATP